MKMTEISVSIPNSVFKTTEQFAKSMGMSLSELYTAALTSYIESIRNNSSVTERLDQVYATEPSSIEPDLVKLQVASLGDDTW